MNPEQAKRILGLIREVNVEDIRRAYRENALHYHPDHYHTFSQQAWATRKFIQIKEAYDLLISTMTFGQQGHQDNFTQFQKQEESKVESNTRINIDQRFDFFDWILKRLSSKNKWVGFILEYLFLTPFCLVAMPYFFTILILQEILGDLGIKAYTGTNSFKERFAFLVISTFAAFVYFPIFYLIVFTRTGEISQKLLLTIIGITIPSMAICFVISEWVSFFLTFVWMRRVKSDLETFLPK